MAEHAEVAVDDPHSYEQRTKLVESGQTRIYYAAGCECGWRCEQFRVSDERAVTDWFNHAEGNRCATCDGAGCEEGCGLRGGCQDAYNGPDSHKICRQCRGSGKAA